jgi:hemoglobin
MTPDAAAALQDRARRIAQSLQLALFFRLDEQPIPPPAGPTADAAAPLQRNILP